MRPRNLTAHVLAILACVTCHRAGGVALAKDNAPAPNRDTRIEAVVCAGRPACQLESVVDGGKSHLGAELYVAMVHLPGETPGARCTSHDAWLVSEEGHEMRAVHRIQQLCLFDRPPDPPPTPPTIEARVRGEVRFALLQPPDKNDIFPAPALTGLDFTVDPLEVVRDFTGSAYWDHTRFQGGKCRQGSTVDTCVEPSLTLPSIDVGAAFAAGDWRTTGLGDCSMRFGPVRALLSRDQLYVEVPVAPEPTPLPLQIEFTLIGGLPTDMFFWTLGMDGTLALEVNGKRRKTSAHAEKVDAGSSVRRFMLTSFWPTNRSVETLYMSYGADSSGTGTRVGLLQPRKAACTAHAGVLEVERQPPSPDPFQEL